MTAGRSAIEADAIPALSEAAQVFNKEYLSGARQTIAASELPEGKAVLRKRWWRYFTNLEVTPDQVHGDRPARGRAYPF